MLGKDSQNLAKGLPGSQGLADTSLPYTAFLCTEPYVLAIIGMVKNYTKYKKQVG